MLGLVLPVDGLPGLQRRHRAASKFLPDVGLAMYCSFGRQPGQEPDETLRERRDTVRAMLKETA